MDDGPSDRTSEIIRSYAEKDVRIHILTNPENRGIAYSRNRGIAISRGEYIANMDADDWSLPKRFETQVKFLDQHPEISVLGTACNMIDENGNLRKVISYPSSAGMIRWYLIFSCTVSNPSAMMRKKIFNDPLIRYQEGVPLAEDYEFWVGVTQSHKIANLKDALTFYRWHQTNSSITQNSAQWQYTLELTRKQILVYTEIETPISLIEGIRKPEKIHSVSDARIILDIFKKLVKATKSWDVTDEEAIDIRENVIQRTKSIWLAIKNSPRLLFDLRYFQYLRIQIIFFTVKRIIWSGKSNV